MHSLKFIHFDIKPANIMFSYTLKKYVLIDFGISISITELPGDKVLTNFKGTYSYASP